MSESTLVLRPGKFYRAKNGALWCCYRVDNEAPEHAKADCVAVNSGRTEYFFLDGRYDSGGTREHCLVEEVIQ